MVKATIITVVVSECCTGFLEWFESTVSAALVKRHPPRRGYVRYIHNIEFYVDDFKFPSNMPLDFEKIKSIFHTMKINNKGSELDWISGVLTIAIISHEYLMKKK